MNKDDKRIIKFFIIKFIWRFFHLLSIIFLFGDCSYNLFFGKRSENNKSMILITILSSIILVISGFGNMITMLYEKTYDKNNLHNKIWKYILYFKFGIAIFLTPVLDKILKFIIKDITNQIDIARFTLMLIAYALGIFIRYYREYYAKVIDVYKKDHSQYELALYAK